MPTLTDCEKLHTWKTLVSSISCAYVTRENPAANINIVFLLKTDTNMFLCHVTLNFDPKIKRFSGLTMYHFYVKFGYPGYIGF